MTYCSIPSHLPPTHALVEARDNQIMKNALKSPIFFSSAAELFVVSKDYILFVSLAQQDPKTVLTALIFMFQF